MMRAYDLCPEPLAKELLRLGRINRRWLTWRHNDEVIVKDGVEYRTYKYEYTVPTWLSSYGRKGGDGFCQLAMSVWLLDGPKSFKPTAEQCESLANIEVRLEMHDYAQPYPALMVELPWVSGEIAPQPLYAPFTHVLCYHEPDTGLLVLGSLSDDHSNDITTTITTDGRPIENSLRRYDDDIVGDVANACGMVTRIAVNACLALSNFGCQAETLRGPAVDRDRKWSQERTERGERARERLATTVRQVTFDQHVRLVGTSATCHERDLTPTGRERGFGWVRGHWRMQAHGPGNSLRKRILIKPYMVRADKLAVELAETSVEYTG